jgi:hypothetical protein
MDVRSSRVSSVANTRFPDIAPFTVRLTAAAKLDIICGVDGTIAGSLGVVIDYHP